MTKEAFLENPDPWSSHRPLLWEALEATKDSKLPVIELGAGAGSTPYLRKYCTENEIEFVSYDSNKQWADDYHSIFVKDWDKERFWDLSFKVCLLDMAPGEYRKIALMKIHADIIILHDSEIPGWNASDYKVRPLFNNFKYVIDDKAKEKGQPWTTALSNTVNILHWKI